MSSSSADTRPGAGPLRPIARGRVRASDRVYEELLSAIRNLRIPPGASLSETDLSASLQVSRTPLREALARLADGGLVSVVPQVGTTVGRISLREVEEARFVRESLELAAFAVACGRPDRDVAACRDLLAAQVRCHANGDLTGFFDADEALHEQIFVISGYRGAWSVMQPMKVQLDRLRRLAQPETSNVRELIEEHTAVIDALEAGDAAGGQEVLRAHIGRGHRYAPALREQYPDYFTD
ncbi:GntR family transcriptional regulator [Streptomyces sp. CA2R106]|uniref:GntR family transcriptional regulator n=1 Tax=Streptomyces sp. CA2R106 TaxID=3120153 RepID=UPI00300AF207